MSASAVVVGISSSRLWRMFRGYRFLRLGVMVLRVKSTMVLMMMVGDRMEMEARSRNMTKEEEEEYGKPKGGFYQVIGNAIKGAKRRFVSVAWGSISGG
jgi:hypothetical protein